MPLDKQPAGSAGKLLVTFSIPAEAQAIHAEVVGDFTGWSPLTMQPTSDGGHSVVVELDAGARYRFRYFVDDTRWENDWAADSYTANDYGGDDSVVDLTDTEPVAVIELADASGTPDVSGESEPVKPAKRRRTARRKATTPAD